MSLPLDARRHWGHWCRCDSIRLAPVRHETPNCLDYRDQDEVRRYEIAMRAHRAHAEGYAVTPLDGRVDSGYRVVGKTGGSGQAWLVDVVDASGAHDTCTCPNFLGNDLGTCKHVEAVRRAIARVPELRRAFTGLGREPRTPTVTVAAIGGLRLVEAGPWTARLRARAGLVSDAARGEIALDDTGALAPGARSEVRVVHAAPLAASRSRQRAASAARRASVDRAGQAGRIRFDMLARPLFAYQERGAAHLVATGRAMLADDMGLGKTIQAIAACELLRARGEAARILVVTCASLKHQWQREIERFGRGRCVAHGGRGHRSGPRTHRSHACSAILAANRAAIPRVARSAGRTGSRRPFDRSGARPPAPGAWC